MLTRYSDNSYLGSIVSNVDFRISSSLHTRLSIPYSTAAKVLISTSNNDLTMGGTGELFTSTIRPALTNVNMYFVKM
jgi:hypothetical protein